MALGAHDPPVADPDELGHRARRVPVERRATDPGQAAQSVDVDVEAPVAGPEHPGEPAERASHDHRVVPSGPAASMRYPASSWRNTVVPPGPSDRASWWAAS